MTTKPIKETNKVDDNLFKGIVNKIVSAVKPDKIILFGSFAYGNPTDKSDPDILVVRKTSLLSIMTDKNFPLYRSYETFVKISCNFEKNLYIILIVIQSLRRRI